MPEATLAHRHATVTPEALDKLLRCDPRGDVTAWSSRTCRRACEAATQGEVLVYGDEVGGKPAVICDLDGTLALHDGRGPYDIMKCDTDLPNPPVLAVVLAFRDLGHPILFVSGREDACREKTRAWILAHTGLDGPLFMRQTGDHRPDDVVKRELYEAHVQDQYEVLFVLDDRRRVVDAWRRLGLSCFQVDAGDFDGVWVLLAEEPDYSEPLGVFTTRNDAAAFVQARGYAPQHVSIKKVPYGTAKLS